MVDKISSWKFAEDFVTEPEVFREARIRADEMGIECITPAVGSQLALVASALGAKAIVEAGTGTGISGLWLLNGAPNAVLATIDSDPEAQIAARKAFAEAGIPANHTRVISGRAIDVMSNMADAAYDLVFLDADRDTLEDQLHEASRLLRPGGVLAIAHALWRDRVPDPAMRDDATAIYRDVLRFFVNNSDFVSALSPSGDGLLMASKRAH
ncbi:O-methyltransferase [Rhodoluna sp. KAS3]|uniref:O-methyltransferase n=1 Tax=Rhodoluna sp. KAS3 TaxID=942880 RepID=UPI002230DA24|nr:O-methyltransferase [Rhodoluna sp. KAS3]BDS48754.1 putative O-methyltransferase [Rhodoluna sp. KAS3]